MYNDIVSFEWDPNKAASNFRKHGVRFSEAVGVFSDDAALTVQDAESDSTEERFVTLGLGLKGVALVVAYCYRDDLVRIISARRARPFEREQYEASK
jgi:uncharacterized protein